MDQVFSHLDASGAARMVDVSAKADTVRRAIARSRVEFSPQTFALLQNKALPKGDVLAVAKVAGIMAAKKTAELIPLCHPVALSSVQVDFILHEDVSSLEIVAEARAVGPTGVEMEALVAAQVAALTVYDMCKAVQRDIRITDCRLLHKSGGKSGTYQAVE